MNAPGDTRDRLLASARDLIYARSYADVGVQAICELAGVRKGSFYHFFPSKRDLTLAVLDTFMLEFKEDLIGRAFVPDYPPMQRFARLIELVYEFQKAIRDSTGHVLGCPFGNLAVEMSTQDEPIREKVAAIFRGLQARFRETLEEAGERGEVGDIDIAATAQAMFAYMEGVMLMAKTDNDPEVIRRLGPALADIRVAAGR